MSLISSVFIFFLGAVLGSFANVLILRTQAKKEFFKTPSHCPQCGHLLCWFELIPIFSFFLLAGRCRKCRQPISWQYPLVEFTLGLLYLVAFWYFFPDLLKIFFALVLIFFLVVIFVYDLKYYLIPDRFLVPAIGAALIFKIRLGDLFNGVWGALFGFLFLGLIFVLTQGQAMGGGDIKLAMLLGFILGWPTAILGIFLAFFLGGIVSVLFLILRQKTLKSKIPFGPFLILGATIAFAWGGNISSWYLNLVGL